MAMKTIIEGQLREQVRILVDRALVGELKIEEFYRDWPQQQATFRFLRTVWEDTVEAVQHFPAHVLTGKPDWPMWHRSDIFYRLSADKGALSSSLQSDDELILARERELKQIKGKSGTVHE